MSYLQAIVELVKATSWPIVVLVVVHLFRGAIEQVIQSIREGKLKYKDLEVIISRDLAAARTSVDSLPEPAPTREALPEADHELLQIAKISPRAAILESWAQLEKAGAMAVQKHSDTLPKHLRSPVSFGEALRSKDLISTEVMSAIMRLRDIRNRTAHIAEYQPTVADAEEFVLLTLAVAADLERTNK